MVAKHIAFCVDQGYGHIVPTLGIASELLRRGHSVSYTVAASFRECVQKIGAQAKVFKPLAYRLKLYPFALQRDGSYDFTDNNRSFAERRDEVRREKTADSLQQFRILYREHHPDLIVCDNAWDFSGRDLADEWNIPRIGFCPAGYGAYARELYATDKLVLVPLPRFLNEIVDPVDERFKFIGFVPAVSDECIWANPFSTQQIVLASPTTGLLPQIDFCRLVIAAFKSAPWSTVLSALGKYDSVSTIDSDTLTDLPHNFQLNDSFPHPPILEHASLYVGQGGPRSTLEALYHGVPALLVPPSFEHEYPARRIQELGFGLCISFGDASPHTVRTAAEFLMQDPMTRMRVREVQTILRQQNGAVISADLMENFMSR